MTELLGPFLVVMKIFGLFFAATWWLILPPVLFYVFSMLWLFSKQAEYKRGLKWMLLEIRIPREIVKTPKAMEQIFANLHGMDPDVKFHEKWFQGKVPPWASWELVGYAGGVYFFVRVQSIYRNLIEAAIYAQYPNAEIREANDYVDILPATLPNESYDLFGTNFVLAKDDAYPIRLYEDFEDMEEERRIDPMAAITEVMSKLKEGEMIWLQILIEPVPSAWAKKGEELVQKLIGAKPKKNTPPLVEAMTAIREAFAPSPPKEEKRENPNTLSFLTQSQKGAVEAIEEKISKIGFRTNVRFIFIDNRDRFSKANVAAVFGVFSQFNTQNLNAFKPDKEVVTKGKWPFKQQKELKRKKALYGTYRSREYAIKSFILNIEELATIYHFPIQGVEAPKLQRIEAKKGEPPSNLPIA